MSRNEDRKVNEQGGNPELEFEQDLSFQRREWSIQRAGWLVMATIVIAGLIGLFGAGPLSSANAEAGPLQLQYSRFERRHAPSELDRVAKPSRVRLTRGQRPTDRPSGRKGRRPALMARRASDRF